MTIRLKLIIGFVGIIVVANTLFSSFIVQYVQETWLGEVRQRVRLDLNSAWAVYNSRQERMLDFLKATSLDLTLVQALQNQTDGSMENRLARAYAAGDMDILNLVDPQGHVVHRARNPEASGDSLRSNPIVASVLREGTESTGTIIISASTLEKEGAELAEKATFKLQPTRAARPTDDKIRDDGMAIAAAVPIRDEQGKLVGVLYGANLLNRRFEMVDEIRTELFEHEIYEGRPIGTVTIFQSDLRIATNVLTEKGKRAIGTRLSDVVYSRVLEEGEVYADRALVVHDWYITAYGPIRNPHGEIIGSLYVGLLEAPFVHRRDVMIGIFLAGVVAATLATLVLLSWVTQRVLRPIGSVTSMCSKVVAGDLDARVGIRPPGEMGVLCEAVDRMAETVAEREHQLKQRTRQQISRSEQLASVGRLAAGIAHEINNPLTAVLTFAHILRDKENMTEQDKTDLQLIIDETTRVRDIVRGLLDFARERPPQKHLIDVSEVIAQTLKLLKSQKQFRKIDITERIDPKLPDIAADRNQIQQVLLNLGLNAGEAMPDGGTLSITASCQDDEVFIAISDSGVGIPADKLDRIFEPFYTTKPVGQGTGLGLSVSYGIVEQHGGRIEVNSEPGKGTEFTVVLPAVRGDGMGVQGV